MQGVLRKWQLLARPVTLIRHFGVGVFWDVLCASERQTFIEILAKNAFKEERSRKLRALRDIFEELLAMQEALTVHQNSHDQVNDLLIGRFAEIKHLYQTFKPKAQSSYRQNTWFIRFRLLMSVLSSQESAVKSVMNTLTEQELSAVERRVSKAIEKRVPDEFDQQMIQIEMLISSIEAHFMRSQKGKD